MASTSIQKTHLKRQPKNIGRRSQEEREDLEKKANAQRQARRDAIAADEAAEAARTRENHRSHYGVRDFSRGRGKTSIRSGRGRGGFMGIRLDRPDQSQMIGPSITTDDRNTTQEDVKPQQSRATTARGKFSKVKKEKAIKVDLDSDISMNDVSEGPKTQIDGGYISSDPDEGAEGPRQDVNTMFFLSSEKLSGYAPLDEEEDDDPIRGGLRSQPRQKPTTLVPQAPSQSSLPIRIPRRRHEDRRVLINRDTKLPSYLENRQFDDDIDLDVPGSDEITGGEPRRKGKSRNRNIPHLREGRGTTGLHNEEERELAGIDVKSEARDEQTSNSARNLSSHNINSLDGPDEASPIAIQDKSKGKQRKRLDAKTNVSKFASVEDQLESEIQQNELRDLRHELGPPSTVEDFAPKPGNLTTNAAPSFSAVDNKINNVYLFQLPPVIPELRTIDPTKIDHGLMGKGKVLQPAAKKAQIRGTEEELTKVDDSEIMESVPNSQLRNAFDCPGRIGKLRIHESGRASLSWGGTSMELSMGINASFLQTAVMAKVEGSDPGVVSEEYAGDVMSFGQVRGKFVVTPDWKDVFS